MRVIEIKECIKDFMCQECKKRPVKYEVRASFYPPFIWSPIHVFYVCEDCVKKYRFIFGEDCVSSHV